MVKATMVIFLSETHLEVFEPFQRHYEIDHPANLVYETAVNAARLRAKASGFDVVDEYFEENEFGDPITCLFLEAK